MSTNASNCQAVSQSGTGQDERGGRGQHKEECFLGQAASRRQAGSSKTGARVSSSLIYSIFFSFLQQLGNSQKEYEKTVVTFSVKNQVRYRGNLGNSCYFLPANRQ